MPNFFDDVLDLGLGELPGRRIALARRQRRRADHLPTLPARARRPELARLVERARRRALAAGMGDLGRRQRALLLEEPHQPLVALDLAVVPHAEIALGDPAARLDGAVLGEDDAELAQRELAEMDDVVVVHQPVGGAVLHHRRDHRPVGRGDAAHRERREQKRLRQVRTLPAERPEHRPAPAPRPILCAMFDLVIRNGTVIDGSGGPRHVADVAVQDGRIAAVGPKLGRASARSRPAA